jgi:hypothetical protein
VVLIVGVAGGRVLEAIQGLYVYSHEGKWRLAHFNRVGSESCGVARTMSSRTRE